MTSLNMFVYWIWMNDTKALFYVSKYKLLFMYIAHILYFKYMPIYNIALGMQAYLILL